MPAGKFTAKRATRFLDVLAASGSIDKAAKAAGISRRSAFRWKAADTGFAERWEQAYEAGTDRLEDVSVEIATAGYVRRRIVKPDGTVIEERDISERHLELQLKARRPDKYRERVQTEHVGKDGAALANINIAALTNAQLDQLIARLEGRQSADAPDRGAGAPAPAGYGQVH